MISAFIPLVTFIYGTIFASGIVCTTQRCLTNRPLLVARSCCDHCHHPLTWWQLWPCIGWLIQHGRCHFCHHPISEHYLLVEILAGSTLAMTVTRQSLPQTILTACFCLALLALSVQDHRTQTVSASGLTQLAGLSMTHYLWAQRSWWPLMLVILGYLLLQACCRYWPVIGAGDLDLMVILWLWFDTTRTLVIIFLACWVFLLFAWRTASRQRLPFFPALWIGSCLTLMILP
ncbi:prepilin peptidase [Furfurilactobacillus sp. WILCCON 0119]